MVVILVFYQSNRHLKKDKRKIYKVAKRNSGMNSKSIKIPNSLHSRLWRIKSKIVLSSGENIHLYEIIEKALDQSKYKKEFE